MENQTNNPTDGGDQWIDLNCDVGESSGDQIIGNDQVLIPLVTSANIACGAHGGDREHVANAVKIAVQHGVRIGAHPSYPDRENFGRQPMDLTELELADTLSQQLAFLADIVSEQDASISYVKPHGALYHRCSQDTTTARVVVETARAFDASLSMMGQGGTEFERVCETMTVPYIREAFVDRRYLECGQLKPRRFSDAVITDPNAAALQGASIALKNVVALDSDQKITVVADSICVHGDNPIAAETLRLIRAKILAAGVSIGSRVLRHGSQ